ncbi:hypothetical protein [Lentzea sp. NPDC055074]
MPRFPAAVRVTGAAAAVPHEQAARLHRGEEQLVRVEGDRVGPRISSSIRKSAPYAPSTCSHRSSAARRSAIASIGSTDPVGTVTDERTAAELRRQSCEPTGLDLGEVLGL